jgi:hypothetical protein
MGNKKTEPVQASAPGFSKSADSAAGRNSVFLENDAGVGTVSDGAEAGSEPI